MEKAEKTLALLLPAVLAAAVGIYIYSVCSGLLHMKELGQMFLFTGEYLSDAFRLPGGPAGYVGQFLTQFSYYPALGAAVCAFLLLCVQALSFRIYGGRTIWALTLSITAAAGALPFLLVENSLVGGVVAIIIALLPVRVGLRYPAFRIILTPALYFLCGPVAVIYPAICWILGSRHITGAVSVTLVPLSMFLSQHIFGRTLRELANGIFYGIYPEFIPVWLYVAAGIVTACAALSRIEIKSRSLEYTLLAAVTLATVLLAIPEKRLPEPLVEEYMELEYLEEREKWDDIIDLASSRKLKSTLSTQLLNLALAKKGVLLDRMFEWPQSGADCLFKKAEEHHIYPIASAEIFYYCAVPNAAQAYWFDMQQAIPNHRKSARAFRRIAETNALNGDMEVAMKYVETLRHTLFYRKWAESFNPGDECYSRLNQMRKNDGDYFFSACDMPLLFLQLYRWRESNVIARDYALALCLMEKNLDAFINFMGTMKFDSVPDYCQQAFLLLWRQHNTGMNGLPHGITGKNIKLFKEFEEDLASHTAPYKMEKKYGGSYLFYHHFGSIR